MKKFNFSKLFFVAALVASIAMFSGCKPEADIKTKTQYVYRYVTPLEADDTVIGTWDGEYPGEEYIIAQNKFSSGYEGDTLYILKTSETSGYIYMKYTKAYESTMEDKSGDPSWQAGWGGSYYRYSATAPDVGKWYAVAYKDLTSNSMSISGAAGAKSSVVTLTEAVAEFTIDNGYFGYYSECTKSN